LEVKLTKIAIKIEIFKEGDVYVALSPELNVSSFGETVEEAGESIKEAIDAFIEECQKMGTLEEVLEEAGFLKTGDFWEPRKPVVEDNLAIAI
jgi:predicted RNase H-like HicB family nuclease